MSTASDEELGGAAEATGARRVIKRYSNRKLYDTRDSRYVTLLQIADMVRAGEDVQIIDNRTKDDKTDVTLALIISEELKTKPRAIPLATLKALIRLRGERLLTQLRSGPIGRLIPREPGDSDAGGADEAAPSEAAPSVEGNHEEESAMTSSDERPGEDENRDATKGLQRVLQTSRATLETWHQAIDERIRAALPDFAILRELEQRVRTLTERLESLERRLSGRERGEPKAPSVEPPPDRE